LDQTQISTTGNPGRFEWLAFQRAGHGNANAAERIFSAQAVLCFLAT
jgi:hypothetical protein